MYNMEIDKGEYNEKEILQAAIKKRMELDRMGFVDGFEPTDLMYMSAGYAEIEEIRKEQEKDNNIFPFARDYHGNEPDPMRMISDGYAERNDYFNGKDKNAW